MTCNVDFIAVIESFSTVSSNCITADGLLPSRRSPYKALRCRGCLRLTSRCGRLCGLEERLTCKGARGECSVPERGRVRAKSGEPDKLPRAESTAPQNEVPTLFELFMYSILTPYATRLLNHSSPLSYLLINMDASISRIHRGSRRTSNTCPLPSGDSACHTRSWASSMP